MVMPQSTWAVVATVDEPPALVQAFVAWHLELGAQQVFIYCDQPDDPVRAKLAHLAQVTVVPCDENHWLRLGKSRPRRHQVRQVRNARDAYGRTKVDWLLHIDADEFIFPTESVAGSLEAADPNTDCLAVPVAERVDIQGARPGSVLDGAFRRPFRQSRTRGREVFGDDYDLTYRGLTGHSQGKSFVRAGRRLNMSIHRPRPHKSDQSIVIARPENCALELLHFEGLTPTYWTYKLARMVRALAQNDGMPPSPHRRRQADALIAAPDHAEQIYRRLKTVDESAKALLKRHDLWFEPAFDLTGAMERYFPNEDIDLSPEAIDQWLWVHKPRVIPFLRS